MKRKLDYEIEGVEGKDEVIIKLILDAKSSSMRWILNAAFFRLRGYNKAAQKILMDNLETVKEWEIPPENKEQIFPLIKIGSSKIINNIKELENKAGLIIYEHSIEKVCYSLKDKKLIMTIYYRAPATKK